MTMDRRELLKRSGVVTAGLALGASTLPQASFAQDATELDFWDTLAAPPRSDIAEMLAKNFSEAHDGMKVEHRGFATPDEIADTLPRAVDSDQGPDVAQVNNGEALAGPMIRAGQLVSIQKYVSEYGWDKLMPEGLLARNRFSPDGKTFGEGDLWGVSAEAEIVGFYYSKKIFEENSLAVPKTFAEFETLLGALREAGIEPLLFGNLDKWQAIHLFGEIQGTFTTREFLDNLIYRRGDASFTDESMVKAADKVIEWKNNNYFLEGFEGINGDDATPLFTSGGGAILMQGSWAAGQVKDGMGDDAGFFLMPPQEEGDTVMNVGGVGIPYSITTNAEDPDVAAEFINSLVSEDARNLFIDAGVLPSGEIPAEAIKENTLSGDLYGAWNAALDADAIGHYLDWAAPDFYDTLTGELQKLLAGEVDAEAFTTALQDFYAKSLES
ncbi:MAG TPA: extracellular solute-binding protein [Thermomicrobiales bacterium]|nr:extracellular solute-binding protein [Thermomicrobiales bacterium]